jgi:hypothetical protein
VRSWPPEAAFLSCLCSLKWSIIARTGPSSVSSLTARTRSRRSLPPWALPDLHFDREQYIAEIERASRDGSWETDRRKTARLVYERLDPLGLNLPPDLHPAWASPAWRGDGVALMFQRLTRAPRPEVRHQVLLLTSTLDAPEQAAEDMAQRLLSTSPDAWVDSFGQHSPGPRRRRAT